MYVECFMFSTGFYTHSGIYHIHACKGSSNVLMCIIDTLMDNNMNITGSHTHCIYVRMCMWPVYLAIHTYTGSNVLMCIIDTLMDNMNITGSHTHCT